jgi:hypothetical protein
VVIFVAGETSRVQAFESLSQILDHDDFAFGRRDVLGVMAFFAFQLSMFTKQEVTGLLMVELFFGCFPLKDSESLAVMFSVAAGAIGIALSAIKDAAMHALMGSHKLIDFAMTVQTLQLRFTGAEGMTGGAL